MQVFFFRAGQNLGNKAYFPHHEGDQAEPEILEAFIGQFYENRPVPREIFVNHKLAGAALIGEALSSRMGHNVKLHKPQRGDKMNLMRHAVQNAKEALARQVSESASQRKLLNGVAEAFGLDSALERIEVFDNSHLQGTNQLGGMIVAGPEGFMKPNIVNLILRMKRRDRVTITP